jgi:hypothetical protein
MQHIIFSITVASVVIDYSAIGPLHLIRFVQKYFSQKDLGVDMQSWL